MALAAATTYLVEEYVPGLLKNRSILSESDQNEYEIKSVQVLPVTTDGTFMLSLCTRVKVDLQETANNANILHLDLVIKLSPPEIPPELFVRMLRPMFVNEILVYTKILSQLTHIGYYPKYYHGTATEKDCSLVLGDFGVDGWRMAPTLVNLSLEHILLAVRYLGKFHGNCYAMKELNNDEFHGIARQLARTRFEKEQPPGMWANLSQLAPLRGIDAVRSRREEFPIAEEDLKQFEKEFKDPAQLGKELVLPVEPLAIICHGDYLRNNIAYKYKDADKPTDPIAVTMFDFQTMCYTSPMMDLVTFIANSTGTDVRRPHFEEIFIAYHEELLNVLGEKMNDAWDEQLQSKYSYSNFMREFQRLLPFGYSIAATFIGFLHEPMTESIADMEDSDENCQALLRRGGDVVDRELAGLIYDICQLRKAKE